VLCGTPNSKISAFLEIDFKISNDCFFVLSPATVYVNRAGLFSFFAILKAALIGFNIFFS
tara:strand:- start:1243 stop:1422 length:180 start_codon:yes stop_codon:yes gene_type:complete